MREADERWAVGVDLGGTKVELAQVDATGRLGRRLRLRTEVASGPAAIEAEVARAVRELREAIDAPPSGVGIGVAGQIDPAEGLVRFAPNLDWRDVPLRRELERLIGLPVVVTNDVRAATWGEWLHGAGKGCDDLVCLFVGTGIGGGVVSGGRMLAGCSNTAGELGHMTIDLHGPPCHCRNKGCLEALAGGWAIALKAQQAIAADPRAGARLLALAGGQALAVSARHVAEAAHAGDPLARRVAEEVAEALVAGAVAIVNAFNPCRLILGGGVIEGLPELVEEIDRGLQRRALEAASAPLQALKARFGQDAGVVGAASLVVRPYPDEKSPPARSRPA